MAWVWVVRWWGWLGWFWWGVGDAWSLLEPSGVVREIPTVRPMVGTVARRLRRRSEDRITRRGVVGREVGKSDCTPSGTRREQKAGVSRRASRNFYRCFQLRPMSFLVVKPNRRLYPFELKGGDCATRHLARELRMGPA